MVRNKKREITQQTFVCFKEGLRLKKHLKKVHRKREPRALTRCGCKAFIRVSFVGETARWQVKDFLDTHIYEMLAAKYIGISRYIKICMNVTLFK
ncbi:FAR1 DNA-binding domain [Sesbania bispinosa]|nr:FAR1 DNA-binding domain [Sesbania bispinosa]